MTADEVAVLKAERDRLGSYNSHLIADREILFAENTRLRAALEELLKHKDVLGVPASIRHIARRALGGK